MDKKEPIELTDSELDEIHNLYFWENGSEGNIYRIFLGGNYRILLKLFYAPGCGLILPQSTLDSKQKKIEYLSSIILPNEIQIHSPVTLNGQFIGYMMNEAINYEPFAFNTSSTNKKLIFLNKLRKQLTSFHKLGIIYGDLKSNNVLSHQQNYRRGCLCDLDNAQVGNYPIDLKSEYVEEFLFQYGHVDEILDWYVLNLLTLESVYRLDLTTYEAYKETRSFMDHYSGKSETLKKMQHIRKYFDGSLLLDDPNFYEELGVPYLLKK